MFVTHANGKELENGVGINARRYIGHASTVRVATARAAEQISTFFPFRKNSATKLTITVERTK